MIAGLYFFSGDRGIRTLDTLWGHTHFPGVPLQPLEQVSVKRVANLSLLALFKKFICVSCC
jgi:hypothetical protein